MKLDIMLQLVAGLLTDGKPATSPTTDRLQQADQLPLIQQVQVALLFLHCLIGGHQPLR